MKDSAAELVSDVTQEEKSKEELLAQKSPSEKIEFSEKFWWGAFIACLGVLIFAYLNMLTEAYHMWQGGLYSHGYLIPGIALVLFWLRRHPIGDVPMSQRLIGVGCLAFSQYLRVVFCAYTTLDMWTFIMAFMSLILIVGGFRMLRWAGPVGVLLIFMFPIPWQWEQALLMPMQEFATTVSTYFLQTLGFTALQEGNTIHLSHGKIGVVEQCSGLRMTTILLALSVSLVLLNERKHWENAVILIMAIPIALLTNIIRITVTAMVLSFWPNSPTVEKLVHDMAGFCMVPLAILFLIGLQAMMSNLFIEEEKSHVGNDVMESPEAVFWRDRKHIAD
ncbi:MAG: exosortase/archaeosortase family protein [Planctomycetia bacterium]|nr:exosortase/archaeosortase family protein [Planctomycetia bacterium]